MLISFAVENFWSIHERQELSMLAVSNDSELDCNVVFPKLPGLQGEGILKGAAIYGANATGKSNLLRAMEFAKDYVVNSAIAKIPFGVTERVPFLLNPEAIGAPSTFEFVFEHKGIQYDYIFSLDETRVVYERLRSYNTARARVVFERNANSVRQFRFPRQEGHPRRQAFYRSLEDKTRINALFLSVAVQFNSDELTPVYEWFDDYLAVLQLADGDVSPSHTARKAVEDKALREAFIGFLRAADIQIEGIDIQAKKFDELPLPRDLPEQVRNELKKQFTEKEESSRFLDIKLLHKSSHGKSVPIPFGSESSGTQRLFSLLWPIHDVMKNGLCLVLDEIESSMHPLLCRKIISFLLGVKNTAGAQLVYTTHNTSLLDSKILRRDQIWFVEKNHLGATRLYPLTDFSPRKDELLQKGYLAGRYGAIPDLDAEFELYAPTSN